VIVADNDTGTLPGDGRLEDLRNTKD